MTCQLEVTAGKRRATRLNNGSKFHSAAQSWRGGFDIPMCILHVTSPSTPLVAYPHPPSMAFAGPIDYSALYHDHGILQADLASAAADDVQLPGPYVQDAWDAEAVEHLNFEPDPEEEPETPPVGGTDKDDEVEDEHDAPAKRKSLVLSDEQKKQRMRDQNRRAAEKSRNKRKSEL